MLAAGTIRMQAEHSISFSKTSPYYFIDDKLMSYRSFMNSEHTVISFQLIRKHVSVEFAPSIDQDFWQGCFVKVSCQLSCPATFDSPGLEGKV